MHNSGGHLVVLAYLQRRWSLRDRERFGREFLEKSRECFMLRNTHRTLGQIASDAKPRPMSATQEGRFHLCVRASDAPALARLTLAL